MVSACVQDEDASVRTALTDGDGGVAFDGGSPLGADVRCHYGGPPLEDTPGWEGGTAPPTHVRVSLGRDHADYRLDGDARSIDINVPGVVTMRVDVDGPEGGQVTANLVGNGRLDIRVGSDGRATYAALRGRELDLASRGQRYVDGTPIE